MSRTAGGGRAAEVKPKVRALLILNVQNDFFCDGSCPLPGADVAMRAINELRTKRQFNYVFVVGYHRTANHITFSTNHPGTKLLENVSLGGATVTMMPDYCLQGSWGSKFHKDLIVEETDVLVHYGFDARVDQQSALGDRNTNIASIQYTLSEHDVEELYITGFALDTAVGASALEARTAFPRMDVYVVEDACVSFNADAGSAIMKRMDGEKIRIISSTGREIAALPEFSATLPLEFPIARPAEHETFDFITGQIETRNTPSNSVVLGKEPMTSRDVTGIAPTSRAGSDTQRSGAGDTGVGQHHPFAPVGSSPLSEKGLSLVNSDSAGMLMPDTLLHTGMAVGAAGTDLFTNISEIAPPRRDSHIRRSSNGPPLNLAGTVASTPAQGNGAASAAIDMSHAASAYAPTSSRPTSAARRRSSGGVSDTSLPQQNSSRSARSSGAVPSHVRRGSSSNPPQTAVVSETAKPKTASFGLIKSDSSAAEGAVPWIAPDKFVLIACYGSSNDMDNAILRYGPGMVDAIVEPQGFNSLHYAIRRCNLSMVQVLLKHGANPNTPSSNGSTPLLLACKYNCPKVARRILQHKGIHGTALISAETEQKMTPLMWACIHSNLELVELLFAAASRLHVAATQIIKATNRAGATALMVALAAYDARFGCTDGELGAWHDENDAHNDTDKGGRSSARDKDGTAEKMRKGSMVAPTSPLPTESGELTDRELDDKTAGQTMFSFSAATETGGLSARTDNRASQREVEKRMADARKALAWAMRKHRNPLIWAAGPPSRHMRSRALARAAMVANRILNAEPSQVKRAAMLMYFLKRDESSDRWSAVHFAARTGLFAFIDWNLIRSKISLLNLNRATRDGLTCLQLASWNGQAATLAALLLPWPNGYDNPWKNALRVNSRLRNRPFTELDLAVIKNHMSCSRVLLRAGGVLREMSSTKGADELLHRLILLGDGVAADALVRNDANKVKVHQVLVDLVYRMKYPDACTFTFAQAHNPFHQFLYECTECGQRICVVCKDRCHGSLGWECSPRSADAEPPAGGVQQRKIHSLRPVGFVSDSFCTCLKTTCRALGVIDQREAEGYRFVPNPIDTSSVNIKIGPGTDLGGLIEKLAWNSHEVWSKDRITQGWTYGAKRDDRKKMHPSLVAYEKLSDDDKQWDRSTAAQTLKVIRALGYVIAKGPAPKREVLNRATTRLAIMTKGLGGSSAHLTASGDRPGSASGARTAEVDDPTGLASTVSPTGIAATPMAGNVHDEARMQSGSSAAELLPRSKSGATLLDAAKRAQSTFPEGELVDDVAISPRDSAAPDFEQVDDGTQPVDGEEDEYVPKPIDTSAIKLSKELASLVELLSKNMHEVWAEGKIKAGWRYAPSTANGKEADKTSNMMVPYEFLTDNEKAMSRNSAVEMVKAMIFFGYRFELEAGRTAVDPSELTKKISNEEMDAMQRKKTEVMQFKLGVFNALLFCVARRGQDKMLDPLLSTEPPLAQINCVDEFGRSPLYWSVQRGHFKTCKALVDLSANLELTDGNKVGTLSIAAHAGDLRICKLLLDHGAQYTQRDCLGLTPLHYAAFGGHDPVVALLAKKLTLHARGVTVDFDLSDEVPEGAASPTSVFSALSNTFRKSISDRKALKDAPPETPSDKKQKWQDATSKLVLLNRSTKILASPATPKSGGESPGSMSSRNLLRAFSGKRWSIASAGLSRSARIAIPAVHLQPRDISACNDLTHVVLANVQTSSNAERESQERALAVASATQGMSGATPVKLSNRTAEASVGARPGTAMRGALKAEVPLVHADFINVADSSSLRTPSAIEVLTLRSETKSEHTLVGNTHPPMPLEPPHTISASHILISSQLAVVDPVRTGTPTADGYAEDRLVPQAHELFPLPAAVLGLPIPPLRPAAPPAPPRMPVPSEAVGDLLITNAKVPHLSPLSLAVHSRQYNVAKLLLKFGGDATKKDGSQMSPYDRALAQHAVAVRVCELLNRSTFTAGEGEPGEEAATATDSSPGPDNRREGFPGGVKKVLRADSAAKVTSNLYQHQLKEQLARGRRPSKLLSQTTTEIDADDNDALFGMQDEETDGKKKPWQLIRRLSKQPGGLPAALQAAQSGVKIKPANASTMKLAIGSGGSAEDFGTVKPVRKSAFQAGRGAHEHPETKELSKRDQAERDRQEAAKERARELAVRAAKREEKSTATMVSVLNTSKTVQSKRKYFALWTLFQETATFLVLVLLFAFMTPTSPDYNGNAQSMFNQALQNTFQGPFTSSVSDKTSWLQFVDKHILWIPDSNITTGGPLQGSYITPLAARRLNDMLETPSMLEVASTRHLRGQTRAENPLFAPAPAHLKRYTYAHGVLHKSLDGIDGSFPANYQQRRTQSSVDAPISPSADEVNVVAYGDPSTSASAFQPSPEASSMGNASFVAPMTVANSVVVGAIRVRRTRLAIVGCDIPAEIANVPREVCLAEETYSPPYDYVQAGPSITNQDLLTADNDYGDIFDLDCADVHRRRAVVDAHREQSADSWVSDDVNSLSIEFVLYNPSFNIFGAVRLFVHFPDFGGVYTTVISRCVKLYNGRFQPSLIFEGVLVGQVMLQAALLYRQARRTGLRKWLRNGWNVYEVLTWALFLGILLFDIASLMDVRRLHLDLNQHSQFYDVWSTAGLLRSEVDLISVLFYLIIFRFIKYARLIPGWGPILLSIIMTIQDVSVILYTAVMVGLTLAFSIAHHVAMGTESPYFSSIIVSFEQLFAMSTAQQFQIFNEATPRTIITIYFLLWSLVSLLLLNLFIGIVTDVYQNKARVKSEQLWQSQITELMEDDISERRRAVVSLSLKQRAFAALGATSCRSCRCCRRNTQHEEEPAANTKPKDAKSRTRRWSYESKYLQEHVRVAGRLDAGVREGLRSTVLHTARANNDTAQTNDDDQHDEMLKDPGIRVLEALKRLSRELEAVAGKQLVGLAPRAPTIKGKNKGKPHDSSSDSSDDSSTTASSDESSSSDSGSSSSSDDASSSSTSDESDDSSSEKQEGQRKSVVPKAAKQFHKLQSQFNILQKASLTNSDRLSAGLQGVESKLVASDTSVAAVASKVNSMETSIKEMMTMLQSTLQQVGELRTPARESARSTYARSNSPNPAPTSLRTDSAFHDSPAQRPPLAVSRSSM